MSAVEALAEDLWMQHQEYFQTDSPWYDPERGILRILQGIPSMPAEQVAELIDGEAKVDTMVEWYDTGRTSGRLVFGRESETVQTVLFRPGQYVTTKLVAIDPDCPHDSLSGTDQTDLGDPLKMWRCDGCHASGTGEAFRLAASPLGVSPETNGEQK